MAASTYPFCSVFLGAIIVRQFQSVYYRNIDYREAEELQHELGNITGYDDIERQVKPDILKQRQVLTARNGDQILIVNQTFQLRFVRGKEGAFIESIAPKLKD